MRKFAKFGLLSGAFLCAMASPSLAAEWDGKQGSNSEQVYLTTENDTAITFLCLGDKLRVIIAEEGIEGSDMLKSYMNSKRRISRDVTVNITGKKPISSKWNISPSSKIYMAPSRKEALKLYNAAVTQTEATIKRRDKTVMSLKFPKPNQSFAEFGSQCGVGVNRRTT